MILMHKKDGREHKLPAVFLSIMQIPFYHRMGFGDNVPDKGLGDGVPIQNPSEIPIDRSSEPREDQSADQRKDGQ